MKLRIHILMHVPYEGPGCIEKWAKDHQHELSFSRFFEPVTLPASHMFDWLIIMGGPMSVYEEHLYPWLRQEKEFIQKAIRQKKTIIGICLGAQLLAEVLGAKVYPNTQKEIGWFPVIKLSSKKNENFLALFEDQFSAFHWHGDTFDIPNGCTRLFSSEITYNQAFIYQNNVLGFQFHLEVTLESLNLMVENGSTELASSNTTQSAGEIYTSAHFLEENNLKMFNLLDYLAR